MHSKKSFGGVGLTGQTTKKMNKRFVKVSEAPVD